MHIAGYDAAQYRSEMRRLKDQVFKPANLQIIATDHDRRAIDITRVNAEAAGVAEYIETKVCDFHDTPLPPAPAVIIFNPEYGQRLGDEESWFSTYASIGDYMKQKCGGYWACLHRQQDVVQAHWAQVQTPHRIGDGAVRWSAARV